VNRNFRFAARTAGQSPRASRVAESTTVEGTIERVTYVNPKNGWSVVRVRTEPPHAGELIAVGFLSAAHVGEFVRLTGKFGIDPKWGEQFQVDSCLPVVPATLEGLERYIGSGILPGIRKKIAAKLIAHFGLELIDVLDREPERLAEVPGLGKGRLARVKTAWEEQRGVREIMLFLQSHGISPAFSLRIWKQYGPDAVGIVRENPYRLALDVAGIGFLTADRIARSVGVPEESAGRALAGLLHLLGKKSGEGHVWVPREVLEKEGRELLGEKSAPLPQAIDELARTEHVSLHTARGVTLLALRSLERSESRAAQRLALLTATPPRIGAIDAERAIAWFESRHSLSLAEGQKDAIRRAADSKILVLTGGPGTGKTTIVSAILEIFSEKRARILLASPTGRAARRLAEATAREAKTIHRMLEWNPAKGGFARNDEHPLEADLVVVDETSMLDVVLFSQLLRAISPACRLILVGDADQLPSVGPGRVLGDVIDSGRIPTVRLMQIFRQSEASLIVVNAHRINSGEMPVSAPPGGPGDFFFVEREDPEEVVKMVEQLVTVRIPQRFGFHPTGDIQILTPMNRGALGSISLNARLQDLLNPAGDSIERGARIYRVGDKVIQLENDYERDVFNGDLGIIVGIDLEEGSVDVRFDERETSYGEEELDALAPAYAMTVHKSQGSEYPAVVLVLHTQHYPLLQRNLLYTAVTRGRKLVVVVGSKRALELTVRNVRIEPRLTLLAERIRSASPN